MPSTLSLALSALARESTPPTPAALLPLYMSLAGYPRSGTISHTAMPTSATPSAELDALVAFEHALEKFPAGSPAMRELRRTYWRERLEACSATCPCCGKYVTVTDVGGKQVTSDVEKMLEHILQEEAKPRTKRSTRLAKAKKAQRRPKLSSEVSSVAERPAQDPFAPSSSRSL